MTPIEEEKELLCKKFTPEIKERLQKKTNQQNQREIDTKLKIQKREILQKIEADRQGRKNRSCGMAESVVHMLRLCGVETVDQDEEASKLTDLAFLEKMKKAFELSDTLDGEDGKYMRKQLCK